MNNANLLPLALKALGIWLVISLLGFFWGQKLVETLIPFYEVVAESASEGYQANIYIEQGHEAKIVLAATALQAQPISPKRSVPAGTTLESRITVLHTLVPLVILLTVMFSWPLKTSRQWLLLALMIVPAILLVSAVTAPLQLLGWHEIAFQEASARDGFGRPVPWVVDWMTLTEGGGRWLIPVLTGVACAAIAQRLGDKTAR